MKTEHMVRTALQRTCEAELDRLERYLDALSEVLLANGEIASVAAKALPEAGERRRAQRIERACTRAARALRALPSKRARN